MEAPWRGSTELLHTIAYTVQLYVKPTSGYASVHGLYTNVLHFI